MKHLIITCTVIHCKVLASSRVIIAFAIETVIRLPKASKKHAPFAATFSDMPLGTPTKKSERETL